MQLPDLTPDVTWSVCVRDAETSDVLAEHDPLAVLRTASVGKIFLLVEVAAQAESGAIDLEEELAWTDDDLVADSGLWYLMRRGSLAIEDLCWLIGGVSDNLATNVLLRRVGVAAPLCPHQDAGLRAVGAVRPRAGRSRPGRSADALPRLRRRAVRPDGPAAPRRHRLARRERASAALARREHRPVDDRIRLRPGPARPCRSRSRHHVGEQDRHHQHGLAPTSAS